MSFGTIHNFRVNTVGGHHHLELTDLNGNVFRAVNVEIRYVKGRKIRKSGLVVVRAYLWGTIKEFDDLTVEHGLIDAIEKLKVAYPGLITVTEGL